MEEFEKKRGFTGETDLSIKLKSKLRKNHLVVADKVSDHTLDQIIVETKDAVLDDVLFSLNDFERKVREEERAFILNVLDGVDIADEELGNKRGGTRAIRHALATRII